MRIDQLSLPRTNSLLRSKFGSLSVYLHLWVKLCTVSLIGLILSQRAWSRLFYPQLWAEDSTFLEDAYNLGFIKSLETPFTSYYLFLNRFLATIAILFRIEFVP